MPGEQRVAPEPRLSLLVQQLSSISVLKLVSPYSIHEFMSSRAFAVAWIIIVAVQITLGVIRLVTAIVHILIADPTAYAAVSMVQIPRGVLMATGVSMGAVASMHFVAVGGDLVYSCKARRLTFAKSQRRPNRPAAVVPEGPSASSIHSVRKQERLSTVGRKLQSWWQRLSLPFDFVRAFDSLFGVNGRFFFMLMNSLETLKVLTETYQARQLSQFVYSKQVNSFLVAVIFLNCSLPAIMILLTHNKRRGTQRIVVVVVDLVLDMIYAEAIPGLVLLPIIKEFDWKIRALPPEVSFNDVWANNAVAQTRYVLIISYLDLVTTLVPHLNFILGIYLLKKLLHRRSEVQEVVMNSPHTIVGMVATATPAQSHRILGDWLSRVYRGTIFCWGVCVLGLHIGAQYHDSTSLPGCKMPLAPWHIERRNVTACAVMHLNCYRRELKGEAGEIDAVLSQLDSEALTSVTFSHCPALELSPIIARFSRLSAIEFFNSTIVRWGNDAAVTAQSHKVLHHVFFFATNMTVFPDALAHDDLPKSLQYLAIYGSSLAHIPTFLGDIWSTDRDGPHQWRVISIIDTAVKELPPSFAKIQVDVLQLMGNLVERLPVEIAERFGAYQKLRVDGRCFQELPLDIGVRPFRDVRLQRLYVEDTNVSMVPGWLAAWMEASLDRSYPIDQGSQGLVQVFLHGSRLCTVSEYAKYARFCEVDRGFDLDAFPIATITAQWAL